VYGGVDVVRGRDLYLTKVIPAGPSAWDEAEQARAEMVRQVEQQRHPRTDATAAQLLARYLEDWDRSDSFGDTRCAPMCATMSIR
jgi:integrase